jgi:predicted O-linked N-acetylglucosamine transferase (SPINDLY family)
LSLWDAAQNSYLRALNLQPNNPKYIYNLANTYYDQRDFVRASNLFKRCLAIENRIPEAHNNLSACLISLKDFTVALSHANLAIELKPDYAEAWSNRGIALNELKRHEEALASYEKSIELKPDYAEAWSDRGNVLNTLKRHEEALASYEKSIELKPDLAEAWRNRGNALNDLKRYEESMASYKRAIELKPEIDFLLGDLIHAQMKICDWAKLEQQLLGLKAKLLDGNKVITPFAILGLFDNPELQKRCAEIYAKDRLSLASRLGVIAQMPRRDKIRIGYFSMDFREHPVSHLIAELFELHDRSKFEIYIFSFGSNIRNSVRQRVEKAVDKFLDVKNLTDFDIARLSRQHEIDIAIDLGGHTQDSRPQIFAERVAPIQINYLGYPGTWGSDYMDYFIGDKVTMSHENREHFSEKIVFLPNSFQVNPSHRPIATNKLSRQLHGIPEGSFVFCCFNNSWKITPKVYGLWIQILKKVQNSVLWLYAGNPSVEKNLKLAAAKQGISADRIIFAKQVQRDAYFAQFQHADLFLDTLPYNAGTTASDALWAGLPLLTQIGKSFASRMAASLLTNIGIPELITHNKEEYYSLAIELALDQEKLVAIKAKLTQNRLTTPLFNADLFARHIESAYKAAYDRYHAGLPPDHIDIGP